MSLFEQILQTNLINFLIMISTLVLIFKKAHLGDLIEKMANDVRLKVEESSKRTQDALSEYKSTKREVKDAPKLQEEIISTAHNSAKNLVLKIEEKSKLKQDEIIKSIEKIKNNQSDKIKKMTINEIFNACVDIARDETVKKLDYNAHKKLINSSIDELDKIEGSLL